MRQNSARLKRAYGHNEELSDPVTAINRVRARFHADQDHHQLAAIADVNNSGSIQDRDAVAGCKPVREHTRPTCPPGIATGTPVGILIGPKRDESVAEVLA